MTSSAFIAHTLDPLVEPRFAEQDLLHEKLFNEGEDKFKWDYLKGFKRSGTYALDWAGDQLLIASKDNFLRLYDLERHDEVRSWFGEWMSMQIDPTNPFVAAAISWTGKFRVFDTRQSGGAVFDVDLKQTSQTMTNFLNLCWSPDSTQIAVGNRSDQVYLLDVRNAPSLRLGASKSLQHEANQMVWSPDGDTLWIAIGGTPGKVSIFPTPSMQNEASAHVVAHQYTTISLAADHVNNRIATGGGDCLVTLWDPKHLVCTRTFGFATQAITTLSFNHTGSLLAWGTGGSGSSGGEKNLTIVGADTGNMYWQDATSSPVQQVKWHPKRNVLAYTLNASQLPDERDAARDRRMSNRDLAVVHTMKIPD